MKKETNTQKGTHLFYKSFEYPAYMTSSGPKLKIMQIAQVNLPLRAISGGGGGLGEVVVTLDKEFKEQGHESFVVASEDSEVHGVHLKSIRSLYGQGRGLPTTDMPGIIRGFEQHARKTLEYIRGVKPDIIHDHTGYHQDRSFSERVFDPTKGLRTSAEIKDERLPPILNTLHGYLTKDNRAMYERFRDLFENKAVFFNAVSQFQRAIFRGVLDVDSVVLNGIDVDSYQFSPQGKGYVFNMSSIYEGKGTHVAIKTALDAGKKIIFGGPCYHNQEYFDTQIKPFIDRTELHVPVEQIDALVDDFINSGDSVLDLGEIGYHQKRILYSGADAFLFPVTIDETFGLVSAEANASGVPVISYLSGGVPEVVKHGLSGFTVKRGDETQLLRALNNAKSLSRRDCSDWARANFSAKRLAKDYLELYADICAR